MENRALEFLFIFTGEIQLPDIPGGVMWGTFFFDSQASCCLTDFFFFLPCVEMSNPSCNGVKLEGGKEKRERKRERTPSSNQCGLLPGMSVRRKEKEGRGS